LEEPFIGGFCDIWEIGFKTAKRLYGRGFRRKSFLIPDICMYQNRYLNLRKLPGKQSISSVTINGITYYSCILFS
jgi:hypothetical protein